MAGSTPLAFDPSTARLAPGGQSFGGGGALSYNELRVLAIHAGADPKYAGILARIALAESGGNTQSNASHKTAYQEKGRTYYPEGLWQVSTIHGYPESQFNPINNAHRAVELFQRNGFAPWEASRHGGAGGGWGQYLKSELGLPAYAKSPYDWRGFGQTGYVDDPQQMGPGGLPRNFKLGQMQTAGVGGFDPSSAKPAPGGAFDPGSAKLATPAPTGTFDPSTAKAEGTGGFPPAGSVGQQSFGQQIGEDVSNWLKGKPVARGSPAAEFEQAVDQWWSSITRNPINAAFNTMGTTSRIGMEFATGEVGQAFGQAGQEFAGGHPVDALKHIWGLIGDASDDHMQKLTAGTESFMHLPTHEAIDKWVQAWVPKELQPEVASIAKGGEDFLAQAAFDPLTYSGAGDVFKGLEFLKLLNPIFAGGRVAHYTWELADKMGMGAAFRNVKWLRTIYDHIPRELGENFNALFKVRPDLDVFSPDMKKMIMQTDNSIAERQSAERLSDEADLRGATPDQAKNIFLSYVIRHGGSASSEEAKAMYPGWEKAFEGEKLGLEHKKMGHWKVDFNEYMTKLPDETDGAFYNRRLKLLRDMRKDVAEGESRVATQNLMEKYGTQADKDQFKIAKIGTGATGVGRTAMYMENLPWLSALRKAQRMAITWNPFPHAIKNVGMLAYLAGGPEVIVRMFRAASHPIDDAVVQRLTRIGAGSLLKQETSFAPGLIGRGLDKVYGLSGLGMNHFENGWRQALLGQLDRQMGRLDEKDPGFLRQELLKGALINQKLGDYRNQMGLVRIFEALGGPFVAFRLGIVTQAVMRSIAANPGRALAIARAQVDINANRQGGHYNELTFGGPLEDTAKLLTNPGKFIEQTIEPWQTVTQSGGEGLSWSQKVGREAGQFVPFASEAEDVGKAIVGGSMPQNRGFQNMTLADKLTVIALSAFGMYFHRLESNKQLRRDRAAARRRAF